MLVYALVFTEMPKKRAKTIWKQKDSKPRADVSIDPIEARFLLLEKEVAILKALLSDDPADVVWEEQIPIYGGYEIYGEVTFQPELQTRIPQHGRSHKITPHDFANRRDRMVNLVESLWPELEPILSRAYGSPRELKRTLLNHFPAWKTEGVFRFLRGVGHPLWKYLDVRKVLKPRKLAYAMAGVPTLTWRSSEDRCVREPSKSPVHFNAMRNHIQDCHPKWYSRLLKEGITPKTRKMLPEECGECKRFIKRPDRIMAAIRT
jgi:hypothetical protein